MKPKLTMHDQQLEALIDSLVRRLWCGVILPGIGLQLALFIAFTCTLGLATLSADDPQVVVASLPDDGQPPAPPIGNGDSVTVASQDAVAPNDAPSVVEKVAIEKAVEQSSEKSIASSEVASNAQIEQLGAETAEPNTVRELSVEPVLETRPMLPPDRPAWVGAPNDTSERVHRLYVASFTAAAREDVEADEMLDEPLVAAVRRYLDESLFPGEGAMSLNITPEFVRGNLLDHSTSYVAAMTTQSGTEYQKWVVLQVTPEQREYFAEKLREHKQRQRMGILGVGLAGVLGLTGLANLAFNRRRRRYPSALTPITMAIMPGHVPDDAGGNASGNAVHYVAAAAPVVARQAPRKKRSLAWKALIMMVAAALVLACVSPAIVLKTKRGPHRTEATRVEVDGRVWEIKTTRPLLENELSGPN